MLFSAIVLTLHIRGAYSVHKKATHLEREYYEQVFLNEREEAERLAAATALSIEHALRVCGPEMLNAQLSGFLLTPTTH